MALADLQADEWQARGLAGSLRPTSLRPEYLVRHLPANVHPWRVASTVPNGGIHAIIATITSLLRNTQWGLALWAKVRNSSVGWHRIKIQMSKQQRFNVEARELC